MAAKAAKSAKGPKTAPAAPAPPVPAPPAPRAARPQPVSRLGDDLPAAAPLSREPMSLMVARTDVVTGKVRIRKLAPAVFRVARGQVVHVKHTYRLQEHSEEREEYRFLLRSALDGKAHAPSLARLGDQWGVPEDVSGYLQHEYRFATAGRFTLTFDVGAEYTVMEWGDTEVKSLEREDLSGTIEVVVG